MSGLTFDTAATFTTSSLPTTFPVTQTAALSTPTSASSPSSKHDDSIGDSQSSSGSLKGVGIAIGIAIFVVFLVIISTILYFCNRKRRQVKLAKQSEARLIRRSQIEDAPPPYIRHSRHESMYKGDLPPVPSMAPRPMGVVVPQGIAPSSTNMAMTEGSWTTLPTIPTQSHYPYPHSQYAASKSRFST